MTVILSFKLSLKVEEKRKEQKRNEMKVSEKLSLAADDHNEDGLLLQRKSGDTDSQQPPIKENEEHDK